MPSQGLVGHRPCVCMRLRCPAPALLPRLHVKNDSGPMYRHIQNLRVLYVLFSFCLCFQSVLTFLYIVVPNQDPPGYSLPGQIGETSWYCIFISTQHNYNSTSTCPYSFGCFPGACVIPISSPMEMPMIWDCPRRLASSRDKVPPA